jgi:myo-inositol 2-dehydrogenase / D-chiro-inositol 1-dehydrogenase
MSQPQESQSESNRRGFLQAGSAVVAGAATLGTLPISRAAHTFDSGEIKIGLVGCGGRGTGAANQALDTHSDSNRLKLTAVADPFEYRMTESLKSISKKHENLVALEDRKFVGVDAYKRLLESDVDLVILATPPGFRPMHFEAAVNAGKHVFMEKPVATDAPGVRRVLEANKIAKEKKLAVAVGLQRRHESGYRATIEKLRDGAIGDIVLARAYWNGKSLAKESVARTIRTRVPNPQLVPLQLVER